MANKALFGGKRKPAVVVAPPTDTVNAAGGVAYALGAKAALAQVAATGTFGDGHYESGEAQLGRVLQLLGDQAVTPRFVAQLACYAREAAYMKDMPALLCAWLLGRKTPEARALLAGIFPKVVDTGRMLRTFAQIVRAGVCGTRNLSGRFAQRLVQGYFDRRAVAALFRDSVGEDPSLLDVARMARPKLGPTEKGALIGYLRGKVAGDDARLPKCVREFEAFKAARKDGAPYEGTGLTPPDVEFRLLTALKLTAADWRVIAARGGWHQTRMNLLAYGRHGVFQDPAATQAVCDALRDREAIAKAKVFPYQLLVAYLMASGGIQGSRHRGGMASEDAKAIPATVLAALQDALDLAVESTPTFPGSVLVAVDVSGSMMGPVTGERGEGQTSVVRCVDVAALFAAQVLRHNPGSVVWQFDDRLHQPRLNPRDSVATLAERLTKGDSGGTNYSLALAEANRTGLTPDVVVYFGDMQSWIETAAQSAPSAQDRAFASYYGQTVRDGAMGTAAMREWLALRRRHPKARAVFVNLQGHGDAQVAADGSALNVGGWSQAVWDQVRRFLAGDTDPAGWVRAIEGVTI